jgi:hypothetical protein
MVKQMDEALKDFPVEKMMAGRAVPKHFSTSSAKASEAAEVGIQQIRRETKLGHALREYEKILDKTAKTPEVASRSLSAWKPFFNTLKEDEQASLAVGAMRMIGERGTLEDFEHFISTFRKPLLEMTGETLDTARSRVGINKSELLQDVFGRPYTRIPDGPFAGFHLPQAIADDLQKRSRPTPKEFQSMNDGLRKLDFLLDTVKFSLTSPWVAFHSRNVYSNTAQALTETGLAALNPLKHKHAMGIINGWDGYVTIMGEKVPYSRLRHEIEQYGVMRGSMHTMDYRDAEGAVRSAYRQFLGGEKTHIKGKRVVPRVGRVTVHPSRFGNWLENEARTQLYVHYRAAGIAPGAASQAVDNVFFDYRSLSTADQQIMKRLFPFWVWNKKNIALQGRQLVRRPGRMAAQFKAISTLTPEPEDYGPSEVFLPDYLTGSLRVGWADEGKQHFLTGVDVPLTSAMELTWPGDISTAWKSWVSMAGPARTLLDVYGYGRDPFTGADVSPGARTRLNGMGNVVSKIKHNLPGGEVMARWMEFKETRDPETGEMFRSVNAAKYHIFLKGAFLARMTGTTDRLKRYIDSEGLDVTGGLLDLGLGLRIRDYDLTRRQEMLLKKNIRYLEDLLVRRERGYRFEVTAPSKREVVPCKASEPAASWLVLQYPTALAYSLWTLFRSSLMPSDSISNNGKKWLEVIRIALFIVPAAIALYVSLRMAIVDSRIEAVNFRVLRNEELLQSNHFATRQEISMLAEHIKQLTAIRNDEIMRRLDNIESKIEKKGNLE